MLYVYVKIKNFMYYIVIHPKIIVSLFIMIMVKVKSVKTV